MLFPPLSQSTIDLLPMPVYVCEASSGTIVQSNAAAAQFFGDTVICGRTESEFFPSRRPLSRVLEEGGPIRSLHTRVMLADGLLRDLAVNSDPIFNSDGAIVGAITSVHEITALRTRKKELSESLRKLTAVVDASPLAIAALDLNGNVTLWSEAAARIFGWRAEEVLGKPYPLVPPECRDDYERQLSRVFAGEIFARETRRIAKSELRLDVYVTTAPIRDDSGQVNGILFVIADLTQTKHLEETARQMERRYTAIAESDLIGVMYWHTDGRILDANDAFLKMTGYTREDLASGALNWREITTPESLDVTLEAIAQLQRTGFRTPYEKEYIRKNGTRLPAIVASLAIGNEQDCGIACILDISDQKQLQKQFHQAQKMEAVGRLAAGVAHDFNNLLSVIVGYSELASSLVPAGTPMDGYIESIRTACERATQLTSQLLAFSRQQVLKPEPVILDEVLAELTRILPRLIGEDIKTEVVRSPEAGVVVADRTQLTQIILNLAVNARDAMPHGGTLTLSTQRVLVGKANEKGIPAGDYALIMVADNGCGMTPEVLARIFEPFFTTKEQGKGTGLGLATVYGIVKQSGGYIAVESQPGKGSRFRVYLPRRAAAPQSACARPSDVTVGTGNILLVEDEIPVRQMMREILTAIGYDVTAPVSAEAALSLLKNPGHHVDLLLSDIVMPGMSGRKLAEEARKLRPDLRILFISGYADDELIRASIPGAGFVQKPISVVDLSKAIAEHLRTEPGRLRSLNRRASAS